VKQYNLASSVLILTLFVAVSVCYADTDFCSEFLKHKKYDQAIEACSSQIHRITSPEKLANAYYRRGSAHMAKGDYDIALLDCNKVIELNPQFYPVYNQRGLIHHFKGKYDEAVSDFTIAINMQPSGENLFAAHANRGNSLRANGKYELAIADYNKAIELKHDIPNTIYNLACAYSLANKKPEACDSLRKAIDNGYSNWGNIKNDRELDKLRDSPCYKKLIEAK
jgi:tetratricopeptide (TPR) repeat protein